MGISKFISKVCVQTAVYWGSPVKDGYGTMSYADPVEIKCRWTDKVSLINQQGVTQTGKELQASAEILVLEDLDLQGFLYLGYLMDLEQYYESDGENILPQNIEGAKEIISVKKVPMIKSTTEFVRTVFV